MVVILSTFVLIGCGSDQDAETIAELQATISDLQNQVGEYSALKTELDSANNSIADADIYDDLYGEALGNEPTGNISAEQEIKITGKSIVNDWYEIEMEGKKQYISGSLLSTTNPSGNTGNTSNTQPSGGGSSTQQPSGGGQPSSGGNGGSGGGNGGSGGGTPPADDGSFDAGAVGLPECGAGGLGDTDIHWDIE